jgi:hypothetical protein
VDPRVLFAGALAASGVLLLAWLSDLTFFGDDWDPLLFRRGFNVEILFRPHSEHILLGTTLIYKGIQATLGMDHLAPYAIVSTASFLISVTVLFAYLRLLVSGWLALAGVLPVLFLGAAWEVLLWPFEISFTASMAAGIGALLVLDREDARGDAIACLLLVFSLAFSELALSFALGAMLALLLDRSPWRRFYVVAVPAVLYLAWYAGWGHTAESNFSLKNIAHSPAYVIDGLSASLSSLVGLTDTATQGLAWGRPLLLAVVALVVLRVRSGPPVPHSLWVGLVILLSFWFLAAAGAEPGREPVASRYQYVGAVLLVMVAAPLASGLRARTASVGIVVGLVACGLIGNLSLLGSNHNKLAELAIETRGGLAGIELAGGSADPDLYLGPQNTEITNLNSLQVGAYLSAARRFGSPAYDPSQLARAPEAARAAADQLLATTQGLSLVPVEHPPKPAGPAPRPVVPAQIAPAIRRGSCLPLSSAGGVSPVVALPRPGVTIRSPAGVHQEVRLRRFANGSFPVTLPAQGTEVLLIPTDRSARPWQLQVAGPAATTVCGLAATRP